jgi:diguanylate cyclase (GGDEF)-like protein
MSDTSLEERRLGILNALDIIAGTDPGMDRICTLASDMFGMPIAIVTLLDEERQWLKARSGIDVAFLPRETAFCNYTILGDEVLVVPDALADERFAADPLVTGEPHFRFYAGAPLEWEPGIRLGALCVIDTERRSFSDAERRRLVHLAHLVVAQIRLHAANRDLHRNVEQLAIRQSTLEWTSTHDALTGLPNRTLFHNTLEKAIDAMAPGQRGALLIIDLDEFKQINDTMGHSAGDALLVAVGDRLATLVQAPHVVARLGGDEFGIILAEGVTAQQLRSLSQDINDALRKPVQHDRFSFYCSASIGQAFFPEHGTTAMAVLRCADLALYAAKDEGRNQSVMFRPELSDRLEARITVLDRARSALERDAIVPYYQPKVALGSGKIVGFEALLRWRDPILGMQSPMMIWEAFRDPVLSVEIGQRMRALVMADMATWRRQGVPFGAVAINVSAAEFTRGDLATTILESMAAFRLPPETLELEVTETVFLGDASGEIGDALKALSDDGVAIALDDFGTGHASLTHLRELPVQWLKIDKTFVGDMRENRESAAIVNMCIELAKSFGIGVVAEGVETEAQAKMLTDWNCDVAQGYLFGKPVEADLVPFLLAGWSQEDAMLYAARRHG